MRVCYYLALVLATATLATSCADVETADGPIAVSAPPYEEEAGGTSPCTSGAACSGAGGLPGHCAKSTTTGTLICCTGCVDSGGWCRGGTFAQACGTNGNACVACPMGDTCPSGACVANCAEPGGYCTSNGVQGTYGNGTGGTCICCTGCWTVDGVCVDGDYSATQCGHSGAYCQNCGTPPYATTACAGGVCAIVSCSSGHSNCNSIVTDGCETPSSSCP